MTRKKDTGGDGGVGSALTGPLPSQQEAAQIAAMYPDDSRFPYTVNMGRHRFGEGRQLSHAGTLVGSPTESARSALHAPRTRCPS